MARFWAGLELGAVIRSSNTVVEVTTAGLFDPAVARCAVYSGNTTDWWDTPEWPAESTEFWFRIDLYHIASTLLTGNILYFYNGAAQVFRLVRTHPANNQDRLQMQYWSTLLAWTNIGSTFDLTDDTLYSVVIRLVLGASGSATIYVGGTERATGSADMTAVGSITKVRCTGIAGSAYWSNGLAGNENLITKNSHTLYISGAGTTNTFSSGAYTEVDETILNDGDQIVSNAAGQIFLGACTVVGSFTGKHVESVFVYARANQSGAPVQLANALRTASGNYFGTDTAVGLALGAHGYQWTTNPASGLDWGTTVPAEIGLKSVA